MRAHERPPGRRGRLVVEAGRSGGPRWRAPQARRVAMLPISRVTRWGFGIALGLCLGGGAARADRVDDAHRKLGELEQRAAALNADFREANAPDPNAADRRVIEAEMLFSLKNYSEAA